MMLPVVLAGQGALAAPLAPAPPNGAKATAVDVEGDLALLPSGVVVAVATGERHEDWGRMSALSGDSSHGCGLRKDATVFCWTRDTAKRTVASVIAGLKDATSVSGTLLGGCAAKRDGSLVCWDRGDRDRPDGPVSETKRAPDPFGPVTPPSAQPLRLFAVPGAHDIIAVTGGRDGCALDRAGAVWCWGMQLERRKGDPPLVRVYRARARKVRGLPKIRQVVADRFSRCAVAARGKVYCWGHKLGQPVSTASLLEAPFDERPRLLPGMTDVIQVSLFGGELLAVRRTGEVVCAGAAPRGRVSPARVPGITHAVRVTLTLSDGCAVLQGGGLACWPRRRR
jgi:hypothetical protein